MAIESLDIWQTKLYEYNMQASSDRFKHDYIRATNSALDRYSIRQNLASKVAHITATDDTIAVDVDHSFVIEAGIDRWLVQYGHKTGDMDLKTAKDAFEEALEDARLDRDQEAAEAATDDQVIGMFDGAAVVTS